MRGEWGMRSGLEGKSATKCIVQLGRHSATVLVTQGRLRPATLVCFSTVFFC